MMQDIITRPELLNKLGNLSSSSLNREIKENGFPKPEKIGSALYFKIELVEKWLSDKAGRKISITDNRLLSSKQLESLFNRSSAWVWMHFQKNKKMKQKAVYIRSRPFWIESDIHADKELCKYLDIVNPHIRSAKAKADVSDLLIQASKKNNDKELFRIGVDAKAESIRELAQRSDCDEA